MDEWPGRQQLISTHPVDNKERWVTGAVAVAIFAVMAWLSVHLVTQPEFFDAGGKTSGRVLAFLALPMIGCVVVATVTLPRAIRGRDDRIDVYEWGLAQVVRGTRRSWTWQQVATVHVRLEPEDNVFAPLGGRNFRCVVTFTGGDHMKFNALTRDWEAVLKALVPSFRLPREGGYAGVLYR